MPPLTESKAALRSRLQERRRKLAGCAPASAAQRLARQFLANVPVELATAISGYWPLPFEIDPRLLMHTLHQQGHSLCLPVVTKRNRALDFRAWKPGDDLIDSVFGTKVPSPNQPRRVPTVLLVPMLGFDRSGARLGFGGGYYDRTLASLAAHRPLAVGLAFSFQEIAAVPRESHDYRLDWVVTEHEARHCGAG